MSEKVKYWLELSDYDLETAEAMLQTKRYLYVGFMCHQVIEKILKGLYAKIHDDIPPYTHNLEYLSEITGLKNIYSEEQKNFLFDLKPLNIESRYPQYKELINKYLNVERSKSILQKTKELHLWIKQRF